jgi:hypothetical protein
MPNAPRFHALLERYEGGQVLLMKRSDWEMIKATGGGIINIGKEDLGILPFFSPSLKPKIVAAKAEKPGEVYKITIYRYDKQDEPTPYNVDQYEVWEVIPPRYDVGQMISLASTDSNVNFENYLSNHVFLRKVKVENIENHWLSELPPDVELYFEIT